MDFKAIGFDFFGTIVDAKADGKACVLSMCNHLQQCGYEISDDDFIANYRSTTSEYRETRYEALREVNNCIWVVDTLKRMGINEKASNPNIVSAVEKYFNPWQLTLVSDAPIVLKRLSEVFNIALVSNFTDSAFIHRSLRKLEIEKFFDHIIDSDTVGWRKPHPKIFKHFLKLSKAKAEEAVFIGDDLEADIKGANAIGIKSVLLNRPSYVQYKQRNTKIVPDHMVSSLTEFEELLSGGKI